jgi:hypothetical protein
VYPDLFQVCLLDAFLIISQHLSLRGHRSLARPQDKELQTGKLVDRAGNERVVIDLDGTREAARQRAKPQTEDLLLCMSPTFSTHQAGRDLAAVGRT